MSAPKKLVKEVATTHGYRGYPHCYVLLECGHSSFHDDGSRYNKLVPNKSRIQCYDCKRTDYCRAALAAAGCKEYRPAFGQKTPAFQPCEKCGNRTPFEVKVVDRWSAWCGCAP